eukprot:scaffold489_cov259-Pinguiococcus_pyrenoidosus.AAC.31
MASATSFLSARRSPASVCLWMRQRSMDLLSLRGTCEGEANERASELAQLLTSTRRWCWPYRRKEKFSTVLTERQVPNPRREFAACMKLSARLDDSGTAIVLRLAHRTTGVSFPLFFSLLRDLHNCP